MKVKLIYASFLLVAFQGYSQKSKVEKADKQYEQFAYIDAIKTYEAVAEKGYKSFDMFEKLGNAYYFNGESDKANKWYTALFAMNQSVDTEYYFRYSHTLKAVGEYDKANQMLEQFAKKSTTDLRAKQFETAKDYLQTIEENSGKYTVEILDINSENSDYGPSFLGNNLVFASNRETKKGTSRIQKWNNQPFTKLFISKVDNDGTIGKPESFSSAIDTKFNEATPVFTKDGKTMYFTRNNFNNGKKGKNKDKIILLKIYKATLIDGKWKDVVELPFNNNNYSVAHPALSPDERTLYFVSDMPGTLGQSDIFKVNINDDGSYGIPENLGKAINTEGKETFPFVAADNELYFSSDGHPGLGGLDIFVSKINGNTFSNPKNIGAPVNGQMDDFTFIIDTKTRIGYFSSNRVGGKGYDDIYKFKQEKIVCNQLLAGVITDFKTGQILSEAKVSLYDKEAKLIKTVFANANGVYTFEDLECGKSYLVRAEQADYLTKESRVVLSDKSGKTDLPMALERNRTPITEGLDIAKALGNIIIYFDFDKATIRPDAAMEIAKIVEVMKAHPSIKVDVRSHTDSRQTSKYNEALSERRAKQTVEFMINEGIDKNRLTAKGYGESQLVNRCADGVECSEAEHQQNRRSEFIIIQK